MASNINEHDSDEETINQPHGEGEEEEDGIVNLPEHVDLPGEGELAEGEEEEPKATDEPIVDDKEGGDSCVDGNMNKVAESTQQSARPSPSNTRRVKKKPAAAKVTAMKPAASSKATPMKCAASSKATPMKSAASKVDTRICARPSPSNTERVKKKPSAAKATPMKSAASSKATPMKCAASSKSAAKVTAMKSAASSSHAVSPGTPLTVDTFEVVAAKLGLDESMTSRWLLFQLPEDLAKLLLVLAHELGSRPKTVKLVEYFSGVEELVKAWTREGHDALAFDKYTTSTILIERYDENSRFLFFLMEIDVFNV